MNFTELVNAVILDTARPDMGLISAGGDGRIPQAILASTLYCHGLDYFFKDIQNAQVVFDFEQHIQVIDTASIPRYKSISYLKKIHKPIVSNNQVPGSGFGQFAFGQSGFGTTTFDDGSCASTGLPQLFSLPYYHKQRDYIKIISATDALDHYELEKVDVAYQVNNEIYIKFYAKHGKIQFGWYAYPNLGTLAASYTDYVSWIAQERPFSIIKHAELTIFSVIGKTDMLAALTNPRNPAGIANEHAQLIQANIVAQGY